MATSKGEVGLAVVLGFLLMLVSIAVALGIWTGIGAMALLALGLVAGTPFSWPVAFGIGVLGMLLRFILRS